MVKKFTGYSVGKKLAYGESSMVISDITLELNILVIWRVREEYFLDFIFI